MPWEKSHVRLCVDFESGVSSNKQNVTYTERCKLEVLKYPVDLFCQVIVVLEEQNQLGCLCKELAKIPQGARVVFKGKKQVMLRNRQEEIINGSSCHLSKVSFLRWNGKIAVILFGKEMNSGSARITIKWNRSDCVYVPVFIRELRSRAFQIDRRQF